MLNELWIGYGIKVDNNVRIGNGCVIAAEAIVNKEVSAYAVLGGAPSSIVRYRCLKKSLKITKGIKLCDGFILD